MLSYEIHILRKDGQRLIIAARLVGDHAAVRRAQTLAMQEDHIAVWRGSCCVYSTLDALVD